MPPVPELIITPDIIEAAVAGLRSKGFCHSIRLALGDAYRLPKGRLVRQTAIELRDRWERDGCPSRWTHLRKAIRRLTVMGMVEADPTKGIPGPRMEKRKPHLINLEEQLRLEEAAKGTLVYPIVLGCYRTGLAWSDICQLEWDEIDVDRGIITRKRQKMVGRLGGDCTIPLDPNGRFLPYLIELSKAKESTRGVYPSVNGNHYMDNEIAARYLRDGGHVLRLMFSKVRDKAGLPNFQIHDYRRETVSHLLKHMDPFHVQQVTGHSHINSLIPYVTVDKGSLTKKVYAALAAS